MNNKAMNGEGGGIYFLCYENLNDVCNLNLINSNITKNNAKVGGGIKWNYSKPNQDSSSQVSDNDATIYGKDFACFAREIKILAEADYTYYINEEGTNDLAAKTDSSESESLDRLDFAGVMSGGSIPTTYLGLVDEYGQIVTSDSSVMTEFLVDDTDSASKQFTSVVFGQTKFYSINGVYNITGLFLIADPDSNQSLRMINYGIDVNIKSVQEFLTSLGLIVKDESKIT